MLLHRRLQIIQHSLLFLLQIVDSGVSCLQLLLVVFCFLFFVLLVYNLAQVGIHLPRLHRWFLLRPQRFCMLEILYQNTVLLSWKSQEALFLLFFVELAFFFEFHVAWVCILKFATLTLLIFILSLEHLFLLLNLVFVLAFHNGFHDSISFIFQILNLAGLTPCS